MLSSILSTLQTLISPTFVVASFAPMLTCWTVNATILFWFDAPFRAFIRDAVTNSGTMAVSIKLGMTLVAIAIAAYAWSALMPAVQAVLEGRWPAWLRALFTPAQSVRLEQLEAQRLAIGRRRAGLEKPVGNLRQVDEWQDALGKAYDAGCNNRLAANNYDKQSPSFKAVNGLRRKWRAAQPIPAEAIDKAVASLAPDLRNNNANAPTTDGQPTLIEQTRQTLLDLITYAEQHAKLDYRATIAERNFSFGTQAVAPTRMGNVANTIQSYAVNRYDLNFEVFWSRMQRSIQKDASFGPVLQASKTQLDFLISSAALTGISAIVWTIVFALVGPQAMFVATALIGPLIAWLWYRVAVTHYRTFADLLRTSIDLFRFNLLQDLHLPLPVGVSDERDLWNTLDALQSLYEMHELRYKHPAS